MPRSQAPTNDNLGGRHTNSFGSKSNVSESDLQSLPVVLLLGQTGAGKSSFISAADAHLHPKPEVGHGLNSCTKDILPFKVEDTTSGPEGRFVILVDTPGFNGSDPHVKVRVDDNDPRTKDRELLKIIMKWPTDQPRLKLNRIIILHDITTARIADSSFLDISAAIPNTSNIAVATTNWPASKSDTKFRDYQKREAELQSLPKVSKMGVKRFDNSAKSAWNIIDDISPPPAIMLLGQTGCGKSSFINKAGPNLHHKPQVTDGLASCTKEPQEFRLENPNNPRNPVILVDTPGLNDWDSDVLHGDKKHLVMIIDWLKTKPNMKFAGVFYLYDITEARVTDPLRIIVNTATREQNESRSSQTMFLTTKWTSRDPGACEAREVELRSYLPEVTMKRFNGNTESAWEIIGDICTTPPDLLSARELQSRLENLRDNFFPTPGENIFVKFFMELLEWINRPKSRYS